MMNKDRDFSYLNVAAVAASILLVAVVILGENKKGNRHEARRQAVDRDGTEEGRWPVGYDVQTNNGGQGRDVEGRPGRIPQGRSVQVDPCLGGDARRQTVLLEVSSPTRRLFNAIRQVESAGDDKAVGDGGKSVGPYQTGLAAFIDGGGSRGDYPRLAYDKNATEAVMLRYWARYGAVTDEAKARIWNGGPRGMTKTATLAYWQKVKGAMK